MKNNIKEINEIIFELEKNKKELEKKVKELKSDIYSDKKKEDIYDSKAKKSMKVFGMSLLITVLNAFLVEKFGYTLPFEFIPRIIVPVITTISSFAYFLYCDIKAFDFGCEAVRNDSILRCTKDELHETEESLSLEYAKRRRSIEKNNLEDIMNIHENLGLINNMDYTQIESKPKVRSLTNKKVNN